MVGPLDRALLVAGLQPRSLPEACYLAELIRKTRVLEGDKEGARFFLSGTKKEITAQEALRLPAERVFIQEAPN